MSSPSAFTPPPPDLDPLEIEILQRLGTFDLPPQQISHQPVNVFYSWIEPTLSVVNQDEPIYVYRGSECSLSFLLLQAIYNIVSRSFGGHGDLEDLNLTPRGVLQEGQSSV